MSYDPINPSNMVDPNDPYITVNGTSGSYKWCMPVQGTAWKRVVVSFTNYTNTSTSQITYPKPFSQVPIVLSNNTGLVLGSSTKTGFTIPIGVNVNGFFNIEGV